MTPMYLSYLKASLPIKLLRLGKTVFISAVVIAFGAFVAKTNVLLSAGSAIAFLVFLIGEEWQEGTPKSQISALLILVLTLVLHAKPDLVLGGLMGSAYCFLYLLYFPASRVAPLFAVQFSLAIVARALLIQV